MEAKFGDEAHHFYSPVVSDMKSVGKKSLDWDLNNWKWDGDLFVANQLSSAPSDCRSKQLFPAGSENPVNAGLSNSSSTCSGDNNLASEKGKRELEKRRRAAVAEEEEFNDEAVSLSLKLGGQIYPIMEGEVEKWEGKSGKKTKLIGVPSSRACCQVDDCRADLSNAKDYHRRHKVCDVHSKACRALVGNVMQRFCQQCSRFHVLQEFDEGKRSCRRRLAGHNRRRRKTHPDNIVNGGSLNDEQGSNYLLISLLRILSNMHSNNSDQTKDQDLLSHLLQNLASLAGTINATNLSGLLQGSRGLLNAGTEIGSRAEVPNLISNDQSTRIGSASKMNDCTNLQNPTRPAGQCGTVPDSETALKGTMVEDVPCGTSHTRDIFHANKNRQASAAVGIKLNNIDLNSVYNDSQDCLENFDRYHAPVNPGTENPVCPLWVQQDSHMSSPPQTSANSDSGSAQSSSSGEAQSRTDRIVFKLFGKDPNDFPLVLRTQILDWLSHSPTEIESYIRPGCIILTVYLRMGKSSWEELCCDLGLSLSRLLDAFNDSFWKTGWVYARVKHRVAFIYNGRVVLDTPLPFRSPKVCRISSIKPIAVPASEKAEFIVKGLNLSQSTSRLLCALEGKYLIQESCYDLMEGANTFIERDELQFLSFTCSVPNVIGRGFIEVEDHGLSSSFFPFIVAEQDVCSEICMLEGTIEAPETADVIQEETEKMKAKNQALDFIHEMGWLLHRSHLKFRLGQMDPNLNLFPFNRFKWLMQFSVDHDWCAVVRKLLGILFNGSVDAGEHPSIQLALLELCLLHRAVRRNCRPMVELLLRYVPDNVLDEPGFDLEQNVDRFLFKPNANGPAGLTPLHIAACGDDYDNILDALTDDPRLVGIEAWKSVRDNAGLTPNDYASLRGHFSYINLIQKKANKKSESRYVVLDIPLQKADGVKSVKIASLETEKIETKAVQRQHCKLCNQKLAYRSTATLFAYRPAMLSMVAIAAVCVCVALLFKSSPEVLYVFQPFRWERLKYGSS
uniref:Squamosa-binding protein-like 1B n=1 Tax=Paeonia suffruticosa TaxID=45171 RepID=A0A7G5CEI8_PAESU|nr:squamosa-binding protein-like 1B [Paeonia suffruticosa]